jgi:hypothetical protein
MAEKERQERITAAPSLNKGQVAAAAEKQMRDIGADLYLEVQQYSRESLDAERKVVLRKIDWVIMPMVRIIPSIYFNPILQLFRTQNRQTVAKKYTKCRSA